MYFSISYFFYSLKVFHRFVWILFIWFFLSDFRQLVVTFSIFRWSFLDSFFVALNMSQFQNTKEIKFLFAFTIWFSFWTVGRFHWHGQFLIDWENWSLKRVRKSIELLDFFFQIGPKVTWENVQLLNNKNCDLVQVKHNAIGDLNTQCEWRQTRGNTQRYRLFSDNVLTSTVLCHRSTLNINQHSFSIDTLDAFQSNTGKWWFAFYLLSVCVLQLRRFLTDGCVNL